MKLTVLKPTEIEVDAIRCVLDVRYGEEDMPADYPHRRDNVWDVTIDLETGQIRDWPKGVEPLDLGMKVTDCGNYYLLSGKTPVACLEDDYVPRCVPGQYGDYVDFKIDEHGRITNWDADAVEVRRSFFPEDRE